MFSSNIPTSSQTKNTSPSSPQLSNKQLMKRKRDDFDLDESFHNSFSWNEDSKKRIKLDTSEDHKEAINA